MHTYIYDKYGYLVEDEYTREFIYKKWKFILEANNKTEMELMELNNFIIELDNSLFKRGVRIITSKDNRLSSDSEFGQLSLVGVNEFNVSLTDVILIHKKYRSNNQNLSSPLISSIKELWISKVDNIEEKIIPSLKIDNYVYEVAIVSIMHALGLAENAIAYLQDTLIDFGDRVSEVSLTHKRLTSLDSYELLNPFNLIKDSPMRDISDLYKENKINENNLEQVLNSYFMDKHKASILLARVLFPTKLFDLLENGLLLQCNIGSFFNRYNKDAKKLVMLLLKHKAITFIGSDTHSNRDNFFERIPELKKILSKYLTDKEIDDILVNNPTKV